MSESKTETATPEVQPITLNSEFSRFEETVIPSNAGRQQRLDMEMAYFAGATVALAVTSAAGRMEQSEGVAVIESLQRECDAYAVQCAALALAAIGAKD